MDEYKDFLEELIKEAENNEVKQTLAYYDLLMLELQKLQSEIENNFSEAEHEINIIKQWSLLRNSKFNGKIEWIEKKLEAYIREENKKTIEMPHGILKMHKKPDKVEISDLELFLKHAKPEMLTVVPEQIKPDMNKIKAYMKIRQKPLGITVTEGKEEFSYKIRKEEENAGEKEAGASAEQNGNLRIVV